MLSLLGEEKTKETIVPDCEFCKLSMKCFHVMFGPGDEILLSFSCPNCHNTVTTNRPKKT